MIKYKKLQPFECHGVDFVSKSGNQHIGNCLFCGKEEHFYANRDDGRWDCKACGRSGNIYTFLKKYSKMIYDETTTAQYRKLAKERGLPIKALRDWKLGWNGRLWLLPVLSEKKTCLDIRRWNPKTGVMKSTAGCNTQLYGWYKAAKLSHRDVIWVCEGEWDAISLSWLLWRAGSSSERVVGAPGAGTFKDNWVDNFHGRKVAICYDNDAAGEQGILKVCMKLKDQASQIKVLKWPVNAPDKYDIRDHIKGSLQEDKLPTKIRKELRSFLILAEEHEMLASDEEQIEDKEEEEYPDDPPTFKETLEVYQKWAEMKEDLINGLKIMLAVVLSTRVSGEPLWMYIVGPAGSGKTMLLMSLAANTRCIFRSSISAHNLISGFQRSYDPSLLPKLRNKCLIWKDFTEIIGKRSWEKEEIYSTLRGAYDGSVVKSFGNGVERNYTDLYFSMLAGVTPAIHGDKQATLGERFMKFEMFKKIGVSMDKEIEAAIDKIMSENEEIKELQKAANGFLARKIDKETLPKLPNKIKKRIIGLSQLIAMLRASSEREMYGDRDVVYLPSYEIGTRPAKQLVKLGRFLAFVSGHNEVGEEEYTLLKRVAFDTSIRIHIEIVQTIMKLHGSATVPQIVQMTRLSWSNIRRQIDDLYLLGVLKKTVAVGGDPGRKPILWMLSKRIKELYRQAHIDVSRPKLMCKRRLGINSKKRVGDSTLRKDISR